MRIFLGTFLLFIFTISSAQKLTPVHPTLVGDNLLEALVEDFKTSTTLSYGDARDVLYGEIDIRNDSVSCIYSGHQVFLPPGVDPSVAIFMDGARDGINAEHVFPRSKGADFGNPLADMHHVFPCRVEVNSNRGSFPFAEINDQQTESWYRFSSELSTIPSNNIDAYSEGIRGNNGRFEPRESRKGDIARAMFYFYTMYQTQADAADNNFFAEQMSTLCQWHEQDPVDELEYDRTFAIAAYQEDKPNPFILDCSLVERAYCSAQNIDCPQLPIISSTQNLSDATIKYYPNPFQDILYLEGEERIQAYVYDLHGRQLIAVSLYRQGSLDLGALSPGIYILQVNSKNYKLVK